MATAEAHLPGDSNRSSGGEKSFLIRTATLEDLEDVSVIESSAFSNPWPARTFRSLLRREHALITVAEAHWSEILGYAVAWWVQDQAELSNLAVKEGYRGQGIGSALLDRVLLDLRAAGVKGLFLEVRVSNDQAFALYRSRGFLEVATRRDYYRNPREDARILLKAFEEND